jgi:hypothetical protein
VAGRTADAARQRKKELTPEINSDSCPLFLTILDVLDACTHPKPSSTAGA